VAAEEALCQRHAYILISASANRYDQGTEALCTRLGVPTVGKPFDMEHLLEVVAQAVEKAGSG
jgi:hypothetical protein